MKASELKEKSDQELVELERQLRDELFRMRMKHYSGQLQDVAQMRNTRRDIARILTVRTQRSKSN
jgi:large subunit ribosomal protein L29